MPNMKLAFSVIMILIIHCCMGTSFGSGTGGIGTYPLPAIETESLLTKWLQQEKYSVASDVLAHGEILLHGVKVGKLIRISIRPHSPLATEIELIETTGMEDVPAFRSSWELFLAKAEKTGSVTKKVPERIRLLADAVVCINSPQADEKKLNFTGFLIDKRGTIITIAHDLEKLIDFKLKFSGGEVTEGLVLKRDTAKDLSLIKSDHLEYSNFFFLKEGRSKLHFGERIYMLCCNNTGAIQIQSGTVDKPKAIVNSQTLFQVKLQNIFLGSSGSPVVDENGRFIGVVKGRYRGTESRGFLIPFDTVRSFVEMGKK
ncbi:MAG: serine protease [Desulfuromonadaceae bacterium]|nr:serine protease [Desulfuromonadaceae bacterium]